ncbi:response regulator transcription factor [Mucilaginibacter sp. OK098]|uniref:response regulator transcription factor n=1 Tax=Mucilaginibacter sp. OK098 TaxID=1855297 RepID=UPI000920C87E|nr:response regulator transcription factor [Mucilaginibacter sp. OK098]SHM94328.1 two component transcriptional regulator, LuxR family [Mucilaginibacter sp. OK098]
MDKLSIYIADDHAIVVDGLKEILRAQPNWQIIGTAGNGQELVDLISVRRSDVVILDINMPKMNGIQCTEWIKKHFPATKVIILTMFPEKTYVDQLINAGADGCLLKSRGSQDLIDAIERVTSGRSYFDTIKDFAEKDKYPMFNLSERELEIIRLIINGKTSADIAGQLFISEHTVKTHRKNIFRKIGINSISQLATFAINNNLLSQI